MFYADFAQPRNMVCSRYLQAAKGSAQEAPKGLARASRIAAIRTQIRHKKLLSPARFECLCAPACAFESALQPFVRQSF